MSGLNIFSTNTPAFRSVVTKAAAYTAVVTDEMIQINGAYTVTLFSLDSLIPTTYTNKMLYIKNIGTTTNVTVQPGTSSTTNVADTINSKALWTVLPGQTLIIVGQEASTDWTIQNPNPIPALEFMPFVVSAAVTNTTAVNVFDANGAPAIMNVTSVMVIGNDATASNITLMNGTTTVCTIAKGGTAGWVTGASTYTTTQYTAGSVMTVVGSATNASAQVIIIGTTPSYA